MTKEPEEEILAVEVGVITGGKTFIRLSEAEQGLFFSGECYFVMETYKPIHQRPSLDPEGKCRCPSWNSSLPRCRVDSLMNRSERCLEDIFLGGQGRIVAAIPDVRARSSAYA